MTEQTTEAAPTHPSHAFTVARLVLVDRDRSVAHHLAVAFAGTAVEVVWGDIFAQGPADAVVSPANSYGWMDGGIDALFAARWPFLEALVQAEVRSRPEGFLPVGHALVVPTDDDALPRLIVAPTMQLPGALPHDTVNPYLAMRAVLRVARHLPYPPRILCTGLGTWSGRVPPMLAAWQMRAAWEASRTEEALPPHLRAAIQEGDAGDRDGAYASHAARFAWGSTP